MLKLKIVRFLKKIVNNDELNTFLKKVFNVNDSLVFKQYFFKNSKNICLNKKFDILYRMCDKYKIKLSHLNEYDKKFYLENKNGIKFITNEYLLIVFEVFCTETYSPVNYYYNLEDYVVVDIGMNRAYSALYLAKNKNCKHVFGFEPCKMTYDLALENIALNPDLSDKISTFNYGLSNKDEQLEISIIQNRDWASTSTDALKDDIWRHIRPEDFKKELIQLKKASTALNDIDIRSYNCKKVLKIDIEGAEYEVLDDLIKNNYVDCFDMIIGELHLGFDRFAKKLTNFKCVHKIKVKNGLYNVCFIKENIK